MGNGPAMPSVILYSDGACRGNPGPGGYGTILHFTDSGGTLHERVYSGGEASTTNNRMEIMGVVAGLEALTKPCRVTVVSDSQYVVNAFEKGWIDSWEKHGWKRGREEVKNIDLWKRLLEAAKPHELEFRWVHGHAGHKENERCDKLAVKAALELMD